MAIEIYMGLDEFVCVCVFLPYGDIMSFHVLFFLNHDYIGLMYGRYLQFRFLKWPLKIWD